MADDAVKTIDFWRPYLRALRATAPDGSHESTFSGSFSRSSWGGSTLDDGAGRSRRAERGAERDTSVDDAMRAIADASGSGFAAVVRVSGDAADPDGEVTIIESPAGTTLGAGVSSVSVLVFTPGDVPEPYRREPERIAGASVSPGVDAELVDAVVRAALPGAAAADEAQLAALPAELPADVRALYSAAASGDLILTDLARARMTGVPERGDADEEDEEPDEEWRYVMRIVALDDADSRQYLLPENRASGWEYAATEVVAPDPFERVQPLAASRAWFQIGDDWGGSSFVVDLAPGPRGTIGQVLFVDRDSNAAAQWLAPSLTEFLLDRTGALAPRPDPGSRLLRVFRDAGLEVGSVTEETEVLTVAPGEIPVSVPPTARALRTLSVGSGRIADIDMLRGLPALEYLELTAADWHRVLAGSALPPGLRAAGVRDSELLASVEVLTAIAARRGAAAPILTRLTLARAGSTATGQGELRTAGPVDAPATPAPASAPPPEGSAEPAPAGFAAPAPSAAERTPRSWWQRLFGMRD